jgi:hypothetical protein
VNDIGIGAVGAAIIAGLVSLLGLIIGKEQKVSEFRQAWIDDLRKCMIDYLVNINAICDAVRMKKSGRSIDDASLMENYKNLNSANHGITLRVNDDEKESNNLLKSMRDFESIASSNDTLTPDQIRNIEESYIAASKNLLKFEWTRVKRGEKIFVRTKWAVGIAIACMFALLMFFWATQKKQANDDSKNASVQVNQSASPVVNCRGERSREGLYPRRTEEAKTHPRNHSPISKAQLVQPPVCPAPRHGILKQVQDDGVRAL